MRQNLNRKDFDQRGFTLLEVLITLVIVGFLSSVITLNFRSSATNATARRQAAAVIVSDIRRAQSLAISGVNFQGGIVCGYGIDYLDSKTYRIYAKNKPGAAACSTVSTRNYQSATDTIVETRKIGNASLQFASSFSDIFFEPPDPKTYINNVSLPTVASTAINVVITGQNCVSGTCLTVTVSSTGKIDTSSD